MTIRTSLPRALLLLALATGGCGGGERSTETVSRPTLSRAVAEELAAKSDAIADALDAGDVCTAAVRADELLSATTEAINAHRVPQPFQEDLQARANELVNTINCPPPPAPTTTEQENEGKGRGQGRGKKKGHEKKQGDQGSGDEGGDDSVITVPVPTVTVP